MAVKPTDTGGPMPTRDEVAKKYGLHVGNETFESLWDALISSEQRGEEAERARNEAQDYTSCVEHKIMDHYDGKLVSIGKVLEDKEKAEQRVEELERALRALVEQFHAYENGWIDGKPENWRNRIGLQGDLARAEAALSAKEK